MDALGLPQSDEIGDQTNPMSVLIGTRNLEIELQVLAQAFEECAKATSVRAQPAIKNWLFKRSKIHQQQALFLSTL